MNEDIHSRSSGELDREARELLKRIDDLHSELSPIVEELANRRITMLQKHIDELEDSVRRP